jgi:hypothetical protein
MKKNRIIKFDSKERILKAAKNYVESVDTFFDESDRAIPVLLKAMKLADGNESQKGRHRTFEKG